MSTPIPRGQGIEESLKKALNHPLRVELLRLLTEEACSPKELAPKVKRPIGRVSYHIQILEEHGCVELVHEEKRRGSVEHYYRGVRPPMILEEEWAAMEPRERAALTRLTLQNFFSEGVSALQSGTIDERLDRHVTWAHYDLDYQGWQETMALLMETFRRSEEIRARSDRRRKETKESPITTVIGLFGFERSRLPRRQRN
jgi:DNA-binding transcriptional ArsR family regulator